MDEPLARAAEVVRDAHGLAVDVDDRTLRIVDPVKGDVGNAVLRVLGLAQGASPVGAAARGPTGVAAAVWRDREVYLARWTKGTLWVVGYRLPGSSKPNDYVRIEGRIPTRLETGQWYRTVPDAVAEAFFEVGLLLDDPPFPVAPPPPAAPPAQRSSAQRSSAQPSPPRRRKASASPSGADRKPKTPAQPTANVRRARPEAGRVCTECRLHKALTQFVAGSDRCVDCR